MVVSASRRAQLSIEAPAATTVITADEIRASVRTSIPDLLRRVPGADVMAMGASEADVSIRGFNQRISNKVLVLVDGRSVYQDFVGATFWSLINVPIGDIERIEVVRGPGSALYGANAALGVVNIITKPPGELRGSRVNARGGSGNTVEGSYAFGGVADALAYRANVGYLRRTSTPATSIAIAPTTCRTTAIPPPTISPPGTSASWRTPLRPRQPRRGQRSAPACCRGRRSSTRSARCGTSTWTAPPRTCAGSSPSRR